MIKTIVKSMNIDSDPINTTIFGGQNTHIQGSSLITMSAEVVFQPQNREQASTIHNMLMSGKPLFIVENKNNYGFSAFDKPNLTEYEEFLLWKELKNKIYKPRIIDKR